MMLNPRHQKRVLAEADLQVELLNIIKKYDLRYGEIFKIVNNVLSNWINYLMKDEDKKLNKKGDKNT